MCVFVCVCLCVCVCVMYGWVGKCGLTGAVSATSICLVTLRQKY